MDDPLLPGLGSLLFSKIVFSHPSRKQRIVAIGARGSIARDMAIRPFRCWELDYEEGMAHVALESSGGGVASNVPVMYWQVPRCGTIEGMLESIDRWELSGTDAYKFISHAIELLKAHDQMPEYIVYYNHILSPLMRDGALTTELPDGSDGEPLEWHVLVDYKAEGQARQQHRVLQMMVTLGWAVRGKESDRHCKFALSALENKNNRSGRTRF